MKQQTAVDWLLHQIDKYTSGGVQVPNEKLSKLIQKAKQMEKEQIIDACFEGMCCFPFDANKGRAEQYYEQTYKTN